MTPKGLTRDPNTLRAQYLENSWGCYLATSLITTSAVSQYTVGYSSDSLASCQYIITDTCTVTVTVC